MRARKFWAVLAAACVATTMMAALGMTSTDSTSALPSSPAGTIATFAGGGVGDGGPAADATLYGPYGVSIDDVSGDIYIADTFGCRVRRVHNGIVSTVAGGGCGPISTGEGGAATQANLIQPYDAAIDNDGNLYVLDSLGLYRVSNGIITKVANLNSGGTSLAIDSVGDVYFTDPNGSHQVLKFSAGVITVVAGNGSCEYSGDGGPATSAGFCRPWRLALDATGDLYVTDTDNCRVRKVSGGIVTTVAGNGVCGYSGDGGPATSASIAHPLSVSIGPDGAIYIGEACRIWKVANGVISTVAGNGTCGYGGDGGPALSAGFFPEDIAVDSVGNIYIADGNGACRIREISGGVINTIVATGKCGYGGDGGPATDAAMSGPGGIAVDDSGAMYVASTNDCHVRKVSNGVITTVAGTDLINPVRFDRCGYSGDGGTATNAALTYPDGVAVDSVGNVYIADGGNCRVRRVANNIITTFAGTGACDYSGDLIPATSASLNGPQDVAVDSAGNVYIADGCRIRKVTDGIITTVAGNGTCDYAGDGGPATSAALFYPQSVAVDRAGNVYLVEVGGPAGDHCRVREVSGGIINTIAGNGLCTHAGDGGPATDASLSWSVGIAVGPFGDLYIADGSWSGFNACYVRKVTNGIITSIAGDGTCAYGGDGGPATTASVVPQRLATDQNGNLYVSDRSSNRVRVIYASAPVGGIVELPHIARAPASQFDSFAGNYAALAGVTAAALAALTAGAWYARRRWLR